MVGTRKPTEYGLRAAEDIGRGLARAGAVIVSGPADGLDSAGHRAAVGENCPTIAVMGVPIDRTYPAANRELRRAIERRGCVISEYPPESEPVGAVGFCSATASSRPSPGRWWWWRPRKRAAPCPPWATQSGTVSRCSPCRAAFFARLGGDECPSAGRTRKSGLYSGGFIWYTGAAGRKTGPGTPGDAPAPE